jgi:hypothetical protein
MSEELKIDDQHRPLVCPQSKLYIATTKDIEAAGLAVEIAQAAPGWTFYDDMGHAHCRISPDGKITGDVNRAADMTASDDPTKPAWKAMQRLARELAEARALLEAERQAKHEAASD